MKTAESTKRFTASSNQEPHRVVVIGSGLAGLASTCVLAARGYRVTLLEKNDWYGGKAAIHEADGFRFDMGPTILTLPSVLKKIFMKQDAKWRTIWS
ncbi:MAG: phytoene desaturase family protein [Rubripirellula sp.]